MSEFDVDIKRTAIVSRCKKYRYSLGRIWAECTSSPAKITYWQAKVMVFVMLNPSTADAYSDDPTIRRCISFAQRENYDQVFVHNLFAGRATKPDDLFKMDDPEGDRNLEFWDKMKKSDVTIVCAWGAEKRAKSQAEKFMQFMEDGQLLCLGTNIDGSPKHPLYLKADTPLQFFP